MSVIRGKFSRFKSSSTLHRLLVMLEQAFAQLKQPVDPGRLEKMAIFVEECMSERNRSYHSIMHVFEFEKGLQPIETLAAIFHDIVYWSIDRARHPLIREGIAPHQLIEENGEAKTVLFLDAATKRQGHASFVYSVFGYQPGQILTARTGLNEFLSACVAETWLFDLLKPWDLIGVLAGIEATIPFRGRDHEGLLPSQRLETRLTELNSKHGFGKSKTDIECVVQSSIKVANTDVASFGVLDTNEFLRDTWRLLAENNPTLQHEIFRISDYRKALEKVETFLSSLDPGCIFKPTAMVTGSEEQADLQRRAADNIRISGEYLRAKLISIGIIEALAELSGGDTALKLFTGKVYSSNLPNISATLVDFLEEFSAFDRHRETNNPKVSRMLSFGRGQENVDFDINKSPIAAYLYARLSREEFEKAFIEAKSYFQGTLPAEELILGSTVSTLLGVVVDALSEIAWVRKEQLQQVAQKLRVVQEPKKKAA